MLDKGFKKQTIYNASFDENAEFKTRDLKSPGEEDHKNLKI